MKPFLLFFGSCFFLIPGVFSQYVGIGTTTPGFRLDVRTGSINTDSLYRINAFPVLSIKGNGNFFAGREAGLLNTTGASNLFSGHQSGFSNTIGSFNAFTGYQAGYANTTGSANIFTGYQAGYGNTNGGANIFLGYQAGRFNTSGSSNIFTGIQAGYTNTTGDNNTFIGTEAGYSNRRGYSNTAIGRDALYSNIDGHGHVAIGDSALYNQNASIGNTAVGYMAGFSNSVGIFNAYFGKDAGYSTTTGVLNTYIGAESGIAGTSATNNTFVGQGTGSANITGGNNTFIGIVAGGNNIIGNSLTMLGVNADVLNTNLAKATAIGAAAQVGCSNCMALGGTVAFNTAEKVGINNSIPLADLHIIQQTDASGDNSRGIQLQRASGNQWRMYVDGSNLLTFEYNNGGAGSWGWINTSGNFVNGSDARSKKDVQPLNEGILQKVLQLQPKKYLFNQQESNESYSYGFLAQEVQKIFPEFISERQGGYLGIAYSSFGVIAIKAIQEQQEQIATLQQENKKLDCRYQDVLKRLEALEDKINKTK